MTTRHADNHNAGQAYLDLYAIEPDAQKLTAIETSLRRMVYTDQPAKNDDWWWDDALHMAMPPFARLGALRQDSQYWEKLYALYNHTKRIEGGPGLYAAGTGLWYRDKRFLPGGILSPSGKPVVWSRGNGWVTGGHVKTLKALPATERHTAEYRDTLARLVTALPGVQRTDGFWNVNLADAAHLPGPETSGTSFFLYGTSYAIAAGLVDRAHLPPGCRPRLERPGRHRRTPRRLPGLRPERRRPPGVQPARHLRHHRELRCRRLPARRHRTRRPRKLVHDGAPAAGTRRGHLAC